MTICLAALCCEGQQVVVAADRMITAGDTEFEQDVRKVHQVTSGSVVLSAGSALRQVQLIRGVRSELHTKRSPSTTDVVNQLKNEFVAARRRRAEELHLQPLGLNFDAYLKLQDRLSENLVLKLTRNIEAEKLGLSLLVAGVDGTGGHISYIGDPGISECFDIIGFCAIGSGEHHAELAFIRSEYSPMFPLKRAVFLAYQAKRDAEMAPGVGSRYTDIGVIDQSGVHFLDDSVLSEFSKAYANLMKCHNDSHSETQSQIDAIDLKLEIKK